MTQYLEENGWTVLRFWSNDIKYNMERSVENIKLEIRWQKKEILYYFNYVSCFYLCL
ncbi:DUF559 domain-containing protein [Elizabethkingia anophelis]|uniref:DUF559 domain-containing protein n=1 Tax=Elizabethkingia anophelis TaxID=1117645 RepID=UPI0021A40182|nr:DUF559 domain-containing protein [Elizabethkingia anophelis]